MNELAKHIAALLLENDCVIIPGFGGFIAHYIPAQLVEKDNLFLPPMRVVGFNPQLRINDGLLAQSYMSVYGSSFPEAERIIHQQSEELISTLHESGSMELENVGELRYDIHGKYEFTPFDDRIATPVFWGLDSFKIEPPSAIKSVQPEIIIAPNHNNIEQSAKIVDFSKYIQNVAAIVAVIILVIGSFFIASPIENTEVYNNEASMLPKEMLKQSLNMSSIVKHQASPEPKTTNTENQKSENITKVTETPSVTSTSTTSTSSIKAETPVKVKKLYNVIVASVGNAEIAQKEVQHLIEQGYPKAKAIIGNGKARVSVDSYEKEIDAYRAIHQFQEKGLFNAAWVLRD